MGLLWKPDKRVITQAPTLRDTQLSIEEEEEGVGGGVEQFLGLEFFLLTFSLCMSVLVGNNLCKNVLVFLTPQIGPG